MKSGNSNLNAAPSGTLDRPLGWILFALLAVCYAYVFPRWADPNQNSRLDMILAIVNQGTFQIDKYVSNTVDYAKVGDHYYSDKAPGAAFLGVPIYAGLKLTFGWPVMDKLTDRLANSPSFQSTLRAEGSGVLKDKVQFALTQIAVAFVVAALPTALIGVLLFLLLAKFTSSLWLRLAVAICYGLLTPAFAYGNAIYGHQLSACLLLLAFFLIFTAETLTAKRLFLVGLLLGYSVVTEYPAALMVAIICLYALWLLYQRRQWLRLGWLGAGGLLIAAGWLLYNKTVFGGWFSLGYSYSELWTAEHDTGFISLTYPTLPALWGITFGLFRGLFFLSPILLLALPGFWLWWRSQQYRAELFVSVASVISFYLFNASSAMWWGGFAIGPRYVLPALPFLTLALYYPLRLVEKKRWLIYVLAGLALWSLIATWGLSLANQAFPSDLLMNPLWEYALPSWWAGNIARNAGTLLGLRGLWSLIPLCLLLALSAGGVWFLFRRAETHQPATPWTETLPRPGMDQTAP